MTAATVEDQLVAWVQQAPEGSYVLEYAAPAEPDGVRSVELAVGTALGGATYEIPDAPVGSPSRWTGLQLTMRSRGRTLERVLAGLPPTLSPRAHTPQLLRSAFDEVLDVLHSSAMIAAESGHPTDAILLDDHMASARASVEWLRPVADLDAVRDRTSAGLLLPPLGPMLLTDPGHAPSEAPHSHGLQLVLHRCSHDRDRDATRHDVDILRLAVVHHSEATTPFSSTLRASARRALLEAALGPVDHTLLRLDGAKLVAVPPGYRPPFTFDDELDAYWEAVLASGPSGWLVVPDDLGVRAAFWIDPATGHMVPLIDFGTGGGTDYKSTVYLVRSFIALAAHATKASPGLGVVSAMMSVIAQYWAIATAMVASLEAPDTEQMARLHKMAVCNLFASAMGIKNLAGPLNLLLSGLGVGYCQVVDDILAADDP